MKSARVRVYYRDEDCSTRTIEKIVNAKSKQLLKIEIKRYLASLDQDYYSYMIDQYT
jgi:hypothetical protein